MASTKRTRIFISYKCVEPDTSVAREVFEALRPQHDVFIDQIIPVGVRRRALIQPAKGRHAVAGKSCQHVWRNLTLDEWRQFVGVDLPYERTCPNFLAGEGLPAEVSRTTP